MRPHFVVAGGIIYTSVKLNTPKGPWANWMGYDFTAGGLAGLYCDIGSEDQPQFPHGVNVICDFLTGYLGTIGTQAALLRRAAEGGSYKVTVTLSQTVMLEQALGLLDSSTLLNLADLGPEHQPLKPNLQTGPTAFGEFTQLGSQVEMSRTPEYWADPIISPSAPASPNGCRDRCQLVAGRARAASAVDPAVRSGQVRHMSSDSPDLTAGHRGHVLDEQFDDRGAERFRRQYVARFLVLGRRRDHRYRSRWARDPVLLRRRSDQPDRRHLRPAVAVLYLIVHPEAGPDQMTLLAKVVGVNKHVLRSVRRLDEAISAHVIKAKNYAICHLNPPVIRSGLKPGGLARGLGQRPGTQQRKAPPRDRGSRLPGDLSRSYVARRHQVHPPCARLGQRAGPMVPSG